ncbi:MAG: hypothetical protein IPN10_08235 [Saprospiraceae bacterium]|nr:hypothetical protein [Saprospiraceae bacterium]
MTDTFSVVNLSSDYMLGASLSDYFDLNHFEFAVPKTSEWFIGNQKAGNLKVKIESQGKQLKEFDIEINRGFLTGYNEAFIIDEKKKDELILLDPKNEEIIKPILRGRDLKKYSYEFENVYLINTHNGLKSSGLERIDVVNNYVSLYLHFKTFYQRLKVGMIKETIGRIFEIVLIWKISKNQKIVWGEISDKPKFAFDDKGFYAEATTFLMTGEKLKFLLAILNSKVSEWYFNLIGTTTGMGTNRWKKYKIELLPIKVPNEDEEIEIVNIVDKILSLKSLDPIADTTSLEAEIDRMVYDLYGLTEEERKIVEGE